MSIRRRYGEPKKNSILRYLYFLLFGIILAWLVASIIFKSNPIELIKNSFSKIGKTVIDAESEGNASENMTTLSKSDSIINQLKEELAICRGEKDYHKGLVVINGNHLNLRDQASLNSDVVLQIPAGSVVDIMYYDKKTYFLEGKQGNWAKIIYANQEGWVWGNYLERLEDEDPALDSIPSIDPTSEEM